MTQKYNTYLRVLLEAGSIYLMRAGGDHFQLSNTNLIL